MCELLAALVVAAVKGPADERSTGDFELAHPLFANLFAACKSIFEKGYDHICGKHMIINRSFYTKIIYIVCIDNYI